MRSLWFSLLLAAPLLAQQTKVPEVGLTVAGISGSSRTTSTGAALTPGEGVAFQVNYSKAFRTLKAGDLYWEVNGVASPQQKLQSTNTGVTKDFSAYYFTPGLRLKFYPRKRLSPWAVAGGGFGLYQSDSQTLGGAATTSQVKGTGVFEFGGGLDFRYSPRLSFRFEAREFLTGTPKYNVPVSGHGQLVFMVGGGIVFHLGAK